MSDSSSAANSAEGKSQAYAPAENISAAANQVGVQEANPVEFPEAQARSSNQTLSLDRFADVQVELSVEIGRVSMPIGELLKLGQGAVVKLDREIVAPVNVMAQGVLIASGEVVVIDDRYAIRITSIFGPKNQAAFGSQGT